MNDASELPTEAGWYADHNGNPWLLLTTDCPAGFYGFEGADAVGISPHLSGLDKLRALTPYTRIESIDALRQVITDKADA